MEIIEQNGVQFAQDLEGSGDPSELMQSFIKVKAAAQERPVYFTVDINNPQAERLMKIYQRHGARVKGYVLVVGEE